MQLMNGLKENSINNIIKVENENLHFLLMEIASNTSIEKAISSPKIFQLKKKLSEPILLKLIVFIIKNFCLSFNIKENMNNIQIIEAANTYLETYTHSSIKDLILCLKKAKSGSYGKVYHRLDQSILFDFIQQFEEEKAIFQEQKRLDEKTKEASNVLDLLNHLPKPVKEKYLNMLPKGTVNRSVKRMKMNIDKKRRM